jgi:murein DD-endopeptidase MepM/ murein hydrolase activator NlpD
MPKNNKRARFVQQATGVATQVSWQAFQKAPRLSAIGFLFIVTSVLLGAIHPRDTHPPVVMPLPLPAVEVPITALDSTTEDPQWRSVTVASGNTLESIFHAQGLSSRLLHEVVYLNDDTKKLTRLMPGQEIFFRIDDAGQFQALKIERDEDRWFYVEKNTQDQLSSREEIRSVQRELRMASGTIQSSFYLAGKESGMSDNLILKMANIFGWDIDFIQDIRQGDRFYVLYEEVRRDGEYLRDGEVLAATFVNQNDTFEAVRFDAGNGYDYYTPEGRPMRKAFLRAPLNFLSVNSNFNPRRLHPVTKRVSPHRGIDYGAKKGTPVWATGDGKVIRSAYYKLNGHHVFVQHANNIVTKYLHFTKRAVKKGQRVRQGQTVGYVGATGRVTGVHLHYEFIVNGVHRNPRTVKLPQAKPIPKQQLAEFKLAAAPLMKQLARLYPAAEQQLLAKVDTEALKAGQSPSEQAAAATK